jgi:hypothetical protein
MVDYIIGVFILMAAVALLVQKRTQQPNLKIRGVPIKAWVIIAYIALGLNVFFAIIKLLFFNT